MIANLNPFQQWMVRSNLQYIPAEGLDVVVNRLRANGYPNIADGVTEAYESNTLNSETKRTELTILERGTRACSRRR